MTELLRFTLGTGQIQKLGVYSLQVPLRFISLSCQISVLGKLENFELEKLVKSFQSFQSFQPHL